MNKLLIHCFLYKLLQIIVIIPVTVSDNNLKALRQQSGYDYGEYPQPDPDLLQDQVPKYQQSQIMAETKRRKGPLGTIKDQMDRLNESFIVQPTWPNDEPVKLGQVAAVTLDPMGNVVIFHRCDHIWDSRSFAVDNTYAERDKGPITDNTVVGYDRQTGKVKFQWGKNLFYMPHGLTIDKNYDVWITDVALHQVMKFTSNNGIINQNPHLVLGTAFKPGNTLETFCKPTSVAVLPTGEFFVADGYCNARIIKYDKNGNKILKWGENTFKGVPIPIAPENYFAIPHGLALAEDQNLLFVADRENGRVQSFNVTDGKFQAQYHYPVVGDRLFSVAYAPINNGQLYVINGPDTKHSVKGFVIELKTGSVISKFGPNGGNFSTPHDITVTSDGSEVYVAELSPNKVYKFVSVDAINKTSISTKPTATTDGNAGSTGSSLSSLSALDAQSALQTETGTTALFILLTIAVVALVIFGVAMLISRRRKRGCMPFGMRNRRHAWDFPTVGKPEGFKLGNLLDRKRGFEKLNQDASDEEPNVTTNMLSNQQFA